MVNGPNWKTGLMLMVITPVRADVSGITVAMMIAAGARPHLEDAIPLPGSDAAHAVSLAGEPRGRGVSAQMSLHDEMRRAFGAKPRQPSLQQIVQRLLAEPDGRIGVDGAEGDVGGNVFR